MSTVQYSTVAMIDLLCTNNNCQSVEEAQRRRARCIRHTSRTSIMEVAMHDMKMLLTLSAAQHNRRSQSLLAQD